MVQARHESPAVARGRRTLSPFSRWDEASGGVECIVVTSPTTRGHHESSGPKRQPAAVRVDCATGASALCGLPCEVGPTVSSAIAYEQDTSISPLLIYENAMSFAGGEFGQELVELMRKQYGSA